MKEAQKELEEKYCAGLSADACSGALAAHRDELLAGGASFGADFVPVVGDIKSFAEAESAIDYLAATVGLVPVLGDTAGKFIKAAEKALKKGDLAEASKLINKASNEVSSVNYFGQERKYWSAEPVNINGNKVYQRNDLFDPKYVDPKSGKTNLELMQIGRAPVGTDGKPVNLHHMLQKQDGPIAEVTQIFDKEKEQNRLKAAQLIAEIGSKAMDIARTEGQIAGEKAKQDPQAQAAARAELAGKGKLNPTADEIAKQAYDTAMKPFGTGSALQQGLQAATAAIQGLAGGSVAQAVSGAASPYLAEQIHKLTEGNPEAQAMAHAVVGAVASYASGNSALAGAAGAASASAATSVIAKTLYGTDDYSRLDETQKQTISALSTLASGLAGGLAGDSTASAIAGAQAGKNTSENNDMFNLPSGLDSYGRAAWTLGTSMTEAGASTEEINAAMSKNVKGDLPEGANITKAIVEGYKDGVLIAGAAYIGPAASIGKVVAGATISEIANGTYQWFDISSEKNQSLPESKRKTWDYWSSASAAVTGALAPGRGIWQNVGIVAGGSVFTDGANGIAVSGSVAGAVAGGYFGKYAPGIVNSLTGKETPGFIFDAVGSLGSEYLNGYTKDILTAPDKQNISKNGDRDKK